MLTPSEILALPSLRSQPLHEIYDDEILKDVLGIESYDIDRETEAATSGRIILEEKLTHPEDDGRFFSSIFALTFDSKPFCLVTQTGKGSNVEGVFITDETTWRAAVAYTQTLRTLPSHVTTIDAGEINPKVSIVGSCVAIRHGDETLFAPARHLDDNGAMLFDERILNEAIDEIRRARKIPQDGIHDENFARLVADACARSVRPGLDVVVTSRMEGDGSLGGWSGIYFATAEATYRVGIPRWAMRGNGMISHIEVEEYGDTGFIDEVRREIDSEARLGPGPA